MAPPLGDGALPRACAVVEDLEVAHSGYARASHMRSRVAVVQHGWVEVLDAVELHLVDNARRHGQHSLDGLGNQRQARPSSRGGVDRNALLDLVAGRSPNVANQQDLVDLFDRVSRTLVAGRVEHVTDADPRSSFRAVAAPASPYPGEPRAPCRVRQISHVLVHVPFRAPSALALTGDQKRLCAGPRMPDDPDDPYP